jgi:hypothetical protein
MNPSAAPRGFGTPWTLDEDNLLLRLLHTSFLGGQFTGPKEEASWSTIASNMNREADTVGATRHYTKMTTRKRYANHILPRLLVPDGPFKERSDWSEAEGNLLLQFVHISLPGGQHTGDRSEATWKNVASCMNRDAPALGFGRKYTADSVSSHYNARMLPKLKPADAYAIAHSPSPGPSESPAPANPTPGTQNAALLVHTYPEANMHFYDITRYAEYIQDHPEEFLDAFQHDADEDADEDDDGSTATETFRELLLWAADNLSPEGNYNNDILLGDKLTIWSDYVRDHPEQFAEGDEGDEVDETG